jgi:hypothetical protein
MKQGVLLFRHRKCLILILAFKKVRTQILLRKERVRELTSKKPVAVIITMNASARSSIPPSSPLSMIPMPAERLSVWETSMRWSVRKRRPWSTLCEPRLTMAAPMMRATLARRA